MLPPSQVPKLPLKSKGRDGKGVRNQDEEDIDVDLQSKIPRRSPRKKPGNVLKRPSLAETSPPEVSRKNPRREEDQNSGTLATRNESQDEDEIQKVHSGTLSSRSARPENARDVAIATE